jgi:lipopolysaccharide transport system permease protein
MLDTKEELVIESGRSEKHYWKDLWHFRELFYILSWRDIKVRYKQTVIGALWSILRPLLTMIIFTVVFSKIARVSSGIDAPYAIMVYAGMLPWTFFSTSLSEASMSLINNSNLIAKVYFPRLIIPSASVITSFVDFLISFILLFALYVWYGYYPGWQILLLPLCLVFAFMVSMGAGLYLTALNVKFRDFRYVVPFIVQFGLYLSPVGFNSTIIPEKWRMVFAMNPMVGVIDSFRWCLLNGSQPVALESMIISFTVSILLLWLGILKFRKMERSFADLI